MASMRQIFFCLIIYLIPSCSCHRVRQEEDRAMVQSRNESFFSLDTIYQIAYVEPTNFERINSLVNDAVVQANYDESFQENIDSKTKCIHISFQEKDSESLCVISFRNLSDILTNGDKTNDTIGYTFILGYKIIVKGPIASKYFRLTNHNTITIQPSPYFIDDSMPLVYKL